MAGRILRWNLGQSQLEENKDQAVLSACRRLLAALLHLPTPTELDKRKETPGDTLLLLGHYLNLFLLAGGEDKPAQCMCHIDSVCLCMYRQWLSYIHNVFVHYRVNFGCNKCTIYCDPLILYCIVVSCLFCTAHSCRRYTICGKE